MNDSVISQLDEAADALSSLRSNPEAIDKIVQAALAVRDSYEHGGKVIAFGNGGSMADAMHLAEELTGKYRQDRRPFPAVAISDPAYISCTANEYGYEAVFERFVTAHAGPNDTIVAFSTSGASPNVVRALNAATKCRATTVLLTGQPASPAAQHADIVIVTPGGRFPDRVQELHILTVHVLVHLVESLHNMP